MKIVVPKTEANLLNILICEKKIGSNRVVPKIEANLVNTEAIVVPKICGYWLVHS